MKQEKKNEVGIQQTEKKEKNVSKKIVKEADRLGHKFVMCRITASDPLLANALEEVGFRICDILNI